MTIEGDFLSNCEKLCMQPAENLDIPAKKKKKIQLFYTINHRRNKFN